MVLQAKSGTARKGWQPASAPLSTLFIKDTLVITFAPEDAMKVSIKEFDVEMTVKNNGIEFEVRDNDDVFLGDLYVTKKHIIWCEGKTGRAS
jgi:hypothetical protein